MRLELALAGVGRCVLKIHLNQSGQIGCACWILSLFLLLSKRPLPSPDRPWQYSDHQELRCGRKNSSRSSVLRQECVPSEVSLVTAISLAAGCVVPRPLRQMQGWLWARRCLPAYLRLWAQSLLISAFLQQTGRCFEFESYLICFTVWIYIKCLKFTLRIFEIYNILLLTTASPCYSVDLKSCFFLSTWIV